MLHHAVPERGAADVAVARPLLVRVLAVPEFLHALQRDVNRRRQRFPAVEPTDDGRVVGRGVSKRGARQSTAGGVAQRAFDAQFVEHRAVVLGIHDDADAVVVLGGGPDHRRPANVDHLDRRFRAEWVEAGDHEIDRDDAVLVQLSQVLGFGTIGEDAAVNLGVQRLDTPPEHLGRTRDRGDVGVGDALLGQELRRVAAGDQLPAESDEPASERRESGLVVRSEQSPHRIPSMTALMVAG